MLRLRAGDEAEALTAAFIEASRDFIAVPPFADRELDAPIPVPLPGAEPVDVQWNTPDVLRVDAELRLWHGTPGAVTAPETKLLRAMQIATATSVARLLRDQDHLADAVAILRPGYSRFTEGFDMADLTVAKALLDDLRQQVGSVVFWARADR